jgi:hypothetical protein
MSSQQFHMGTFRHRPVHGVTIGILVLDTGFLRLPGDVANASTWRFPVQFAVVRGATPQKVIEEKCESVIDLFRTAIDDLVALGVDGITTTCGFLSALHPQLQAHSPVPIASSSLQQIPLVQSTLPKGKSVGILVSDKASLTDAHFTGVGAPIGLPIGELPADGIIRRNMKANALDPDFSQQESEVLDVAERLLNGNPHIGALVSECANFPPYSASLQRKFGLPVYDIVTLVEWFHAGLRPRAYGS